MTVPSDPIFPDQNEPGEKPTTYIANPVRVQLPNPATSNEERRWTQMDLVALANNILAREIGETEVRTRLAELWTQVNRLQGQLDALTANVRTVGSSPFSAKANKLARIITHVMDDHDDDDECLY